MKEFLQGAAPSPTRRVMVVLVAATVIVAAVSLYRIAVAAPNGAGSGYASAIWMTMARDMAEGVFYRPLYDGRQYGGGRYFPLEFVLQALFIKAGIAPEWAGYPIMFASTIGLVAGLCLLLRRLGLGGTAAICIAVLSLSTRSIQEAITCVRADLLAATLNVWGLVFVARAINIGVIEARRRDIVFAALFFALAFMTKITSVFGAGAAVLALLFMRRRKEAWGLCALTAGMMAVFFGLACLFSGGRLIEYLAHCGSSGTTWQSLLRAPWVTFVVMLTDPPAIGFMVLSAAALISAPWAEWKSLPALSLMLTALVVTAMFASPGIYYNQFIDLQLAAIVFFAVQMNRRAESAPLGLSLLAVTAVLCAALALRTYREQDRQPTFQQYREVLASLPQPGSSARPLLAENNLLSLLNHEPAIVLDPAAFRTIALSDSRYRDALRNDLETRRFRAVVLVKDPRADPGWYSDHHFGPGFVECLMSNYEFLTEKNGCFVFVPR